MERVKEHARNSDPEMSLKERSIELDMPASSIRVILRHNIGMRPWKIMEVQELKEIHFPQRLAFAQWLKQQPAGFEDKVIWSDEKIFVLHMRLNKQNDRGDTFMTSTVRLVRDRSTSN